MAAFKFKRATIAEHNLQPGDKLKCVTASTSSFTKGKIYEVVLRHDGDLGLADNDYDKGYNALACTASEFVVHSRTEIAIDTDVKVDDVVKSPKHYRIMNEEAIELIAGSMSETQFYGYCLGNALKYRLRAGKKDKVGQEIDKALYYEELFEKHKHLCRDDSPNQLKLDI